MRSKVLMIVSCLTMICLSGISSFAQGDSMMMDTMSPELLIGNVWARPTNLQPMDGMDMNDDMESTPEAEISIPPSAVYMTITNISDTDYQLITATSPQTAEMQIHETTVEDDVMRMRELEDGLLIASGETVTLEQGGLHLMLLGLEDDLFVGDAIAVELTFATVSDGEQTDNTSTVLIGASVLEEAPENNNTLFVMDAWARATRFGEMTDMDMDGMEMESTPDPSIAIPPSAIYMNIINLSNTDERLIAVRTPATDITQIHETTIENDVMRMSELEDGLVINAGESASLQQGGDHVMVMGLTRDFITGDAITATLVFESGLEIIIGVPILESAPMDMSMEMDG